MKKSASKLLALFLAFVFVAGTFPATALADGNECTVNHEYVSATEGYDLPGTIIPPESYTTTEATVGCPKSPKVDDRAQDTESGHIWVFKGWDKPTEDTTGKTSVTFTGKWKLLTSSVFYEFAAEGVSTDIPSAIMSRLPEKKSVPVGDTAGIPATFDSSSYSDAGVKWEFKGWDKDTAKVGEENITFTGTWKSKNLPENITYSAAPTNIKCGDEVTFTIGLPSGEDITPSNYNITWKVNGTKTAASSDGTQLTLTLYADALPTVEPTVTYGTKTITVPKLGIGPAVSHVEDPDHPADCTSKAICKVCKKEYGAAPAGHKFVEGKCSVCEIPEPKLSVKVTGDGKLNCGDTAEFTATLTGYDGEVVYRWLNGSKLYTSDNGAKVSFAIHQNDGLGKVEVLDKKSSTVVASHTLPELEITCHGGDKPDCQHKAVCEACGEEYGEYGDHTYGDKPESITATNHAFACTIEGCKNSQTEPHDFEAAKDALGDDIEICKKCEYVKSNHVHRFTIVKDEGGSSVTEVPGFIDKPCDAAFMKNIKAAESSGDYSAINAYIAENVPDGAAYEVAEIETSSDKAETEDEPPVPYMIYDATITIVRRGVYITLAPDELDFGNIKYGYTDVTAKTVSVTNGGTSPVKVKLPASTDEFIITSDDAKFTESGEDKYAILEPDSSADISVRPTSGLGEPGKDLVIDKKIAVTAEKYDAPKKLLAGANDKPTYTAELAAKATIKAMYSMTAAPDKLDFGTAPFGYKTAPAAQTFVITNTGDGEIELEMPTAEKFNLTSGSFTDGKLKLSAGGTVTISAQPKTGLGVKTETTKIEEKVKISAVGILPEGSTGTAPELDAEVELDFKIIPAYTVKFDLNGRKSTVSIDEQTVPGGQTATRPATDPTTEGYTFTGWYKESSCETVFDFSAPITKDTVIYAGWERDATISGVTTTVEMLGKIKVQSGMTPIPDRTGASTFDGDIDSEKVIKRSKEYEDALNSWLNLQLQKADLVSKEFKKEVVSSRYIVKVGTDEEEFATLAAAKSYIADLSSGSYTLTLNQTYRVSLNAEIQTKNVTLTFETNGGSKIESLTVPAGTVIYLSKYVPTRAGYKFENWAIDKDLETTVTTLTLTADTTVYANWRRNDTGDNNGGGSPKTADIDNPGLYKAIIAMGSLATIAGSAYIALEIKKRKNHN